MITFGRRCSIPLNVKPRKKVLHLSLCSQTIEDFLCPRGWPFRLNQLREVDIIRQDRQMTRRSGVSRMAYPRDANRGRGFGAPGQIEEWRPSAEVLDGGRGLDA